MPSNDSTAPELRGRRLVEHVKTQPHDPVTSYAVPVEGAEGLRLRVISCTAPAEQDVACLTDWRNQNPKSFLTEFPATAERTRRWLRQHLAADPSRVLFMVEPDGQTPVGHMGLVYIDYPAGRAEADLVVRGRKEHPGVMAKALRAMFLWAGEQLGVRSFGVRVLADNPAVEFYRKFGFREIGRAALRPVQQADCLAWTPQEGYQGKDCRWLLHMELPAEALK